MEKEYENANKEVVLIEKEERKFISNIKDIVFKDAEDMDDKRENANIDCQSVMGTFFKIGSESGKLIGLTKLDEKHRNMHLSGDIHIHDLDFYCLTTTCCQINISKLFSKPFFIKYGRIDPPKNIIEYAKGICIALQMNQDDQHGGQSIPDFDYVMGEGIRKTFYINYVEEIKRMFILYCGSVTIAEEMIDKYKSYTKEINVSMDSVKDYGQLYNTIKEFKLYPLENDLDKFVAYIQNFCIEEAKRKTQNDTKEAMELFLRSCNTTCLRGGAQIVFSSINYGTDISTEGRMATEYILKNTEKGIGEMEDISIFPIQIFKVKEGINYNINDPNYDLFLLACKCSSKRMFPNFSFQDATFNKQYYIDGDKDTEISYMGCRTRVISNIYDNTKEKTPGRGNLSFTTINLPRLGMRCNKDINVFYKLLEETIQDVILQLLNRLELQMSKAAKNYPFLIGQNIWVDSENIGPNESVGNILKNGTLSCGFIGLAECLVSIYGKHHGESQEAREEGLKIITYMRKRLDEFSEKYKLNFSLLATPAEGLSGRFVALDKEKYK